MTAGAASIDDPDLVRALHRAEAGRKWTAFLLAFPLLLFVLANFVVPVVLLLGRSLYDDRVTAAFPQTLEVIADYEGAQPPPEEAYKALHAEILEARANYTLVDAGKRLNTVSSGFGALLNRTGRELSKGAEPSNYKDAFAEIDERWLDPTRWLVIKDAGKALSGTQFLAAFDLRPEPGSGVVRVPDGQRVFIDAWRRTLVIAGTVMLLCIILGYPLAYLMANSPPTIANVLLVLVLVPFWTSLLVRTVVWIVLLQGKGLINEAGMTVGLWADPLQLIHNRTGLYITMTHVLLPYLILPLFAAMRRIPPNYVRAALSLGATPFSAFKDVYLPLTRQALGAGSLMVFILAVGFYVTPALVGGPSDQMISYYIAFYTNTVLNWETAAALSVLLLLFTGAAYYAFRVVFGMSRMEMA